jgi:hypothetical protein
MVATHWLEQTSASMAPPVHHLCCRTSPQNVPAAGIDRDRQRHNEQFDASRLGGTAAVTVQIKSGTQRTLHGSVVRNTT